MKNKTRLLAAALTCALLLTGCGPRRTEPEADPPPAAESAKTVAYVPLDDRPDNLERVAYLAESVGYALAMPEAVLYRTRLDGQPKNFDALQRGEPWSLFTWVAEQEAAGCDRYILSLDQLHSGGLVSSRALTEDTVDLPGGGTVSASRLLADLMELLSADRDNVVWLLDSVMRLAPTVGYQGGTLEDYNVLRNYGMEPRQALAEEELTLEKVLESCRYGADGRLLAEPEGCDPDTLENYLAARRRKLTLSGEVQELLARPGYENFRLLIGIDDSSLEDCVQKNEIAYLRRGLRIGADGKPQDWILAGVDDLAFKAVTRMYLDETDWQGGTAAVRYYGGTENAPACEYDFQPLITVVAEHLNLFDLAESEAGELQILVLTQPEDEAEKSSCCQALIRDLKDCRKRDLPVVLIDAGNGRYGTAFHEALTKETELGGLLSYAGFLDMAIVTGTALSHGAARYAYLQNGEKSEAAERAFARTLADSVIKDFCYKNVVRNDLLTYIRGDLGGDPNNFWAPEIDREAVQARLERGMDSAVKDVIQNFQRSNFFALEPDEEKGWGGVALENYRFPWERAFEIGMDIRLGAFTEPHQRILGIYYQ